MLIESSAWIAAASAIISASGAIISLNNLKRQRTSQKMEIIRWKKEYFADLIRWAETSLHLLSESIHLCELDPQQCEEVSFYHSRQNLRIKLSAQIDIGRWFFPNYQTDMHGNQKPQAFRGYRPSVLDSLVDAYRAITKLNYQKMGENKTVRSNLVLAQKLFTNEIQKVLDPKSRDEEYKKLIGDISIE